MPMRDRPVRKVPAWDDDPENGLPECVLHWNGEHQVERFRFWLGHPDRLRVVQEDGKWWLVDLWTGERQRLKQGRLVVVERGGRAVVI